MDASKAYTTDTKVKIRQSADGKWVCDTESFAFGTIIESGATPAEAVAAVMQAMCEAYNRLWRDVEDAKN